MAKLRWVSAGVAVLAVGACEGNPANHLLPTPRCGVEITCGVSQVTDKLYGNLDIVPVGVILIDSADVANLAVTRLVDVDTNEAAAFHEVAVVVRGFWVPPAEEFHVTSIKEDFDKPAPPDTFVMRRP